MATLDQGIFIILNLELTPFDFETEIEGSNSVV